MRKSEWGLGEYGSLNAEVGIIRFQNVVSVGHLLAALQNVDCGLRIDGRGQGAVSKGPSAASGQ